MFIEMMVFPKMRKYWIPIVIVLAVGIWWYFKNYTQLPACQAGTLPLAPGSTVMTSVFGKLPTTNG